MSKDWQLLELQEVSKVVDSLHRTPAFTNSGYPMVRAADVKGGFLDLAETELVSEEEFLNFTRNHKPQQGDIVLSRVGSYFNFSYNMNNKDFCIGQNTSIIVSDIDSRFLYYSLISPFVQDQVERSLVGTSQRTLSLKYIRELKIPTPYQEEQRAIAGILGALDDKIELNRRMNGTLESMARAVFRQWFVESEEVEGWEIGRLGDLCEVTIGGDWGEEKEFEDSITVVCLRGVDLEHLRNDGYSEAAPIRWIKKSSLEKRQLSDCDVLIAGSGIGPVGKPLWVSPEMLKAYSYPVIYSNFVKRFRAKSPEYAVYVDRILFNMRESNEIWDYVNGTSIPNLDDKGLLDYSQTSIPPEDKVKVFYEYVKPIYAKLYNKESRTLGSLRDSLLPKLMRGEVRVKDL